MSSRGASSLIVPDVLNLMVFAGSAVLLTDSTASLSDPPPASSVVVTSNSPAWRAKDMAISKRRTRKILRDTNMIRITLDCMVGIKTESRKYKKKSTYSKTSPRKENGFRLRTLEKTIVLSQNPAYSSVPE